MPREVLSKGVLGHVTTAIEECIKSGYKPEEFTARLKREIGLDSEGSFSLLEKLYAKILDLEKKGRNGIWARLLKNSFAPVLQEPFDLIAGNPPWVNWESLAPEWRELSKNLWVNYGLFSLKGHEARLGGGKKDIAMLFTYACADHYLKLKGRLGFVITQTLFKTKGAGDGFRRFQLGEKGLSLRVMYVDDMSELQPFEGASNRTAILILQKGQETRYPVPYTLWRKREKGRIPLESSLQEASNRTRRSNFEAVPLDDKLTSPWMTARPQAIRALQKVIGKSDYRAYAGSYTGGLNGVYWVRKIEQRPDGLVIIENLYDVGKIKVPKIQRAIEPDLLYPLLRGRDINRWEATPSAYILLTQNPETRAGWQEEIMKTKWPYTYGYLKQFEDLLWKRKSSGLDVLMKKSAFYAMYAVGQYTLSPYKVVWKEVANELITALIYQDEEKTIIPDHTVVFVPTENEEEAYYLCSILNSSPARLVVQAYITGHPSPHILQAIKIPKYQPDETLHKKIAELAKEAYCLAKESNKKALIEIENTIDYAIAELWEIDKKELAAIQNSLKEL